MIAETGRKRLSRLCLVGAGACLLFAVSPFGSPLDAKAQSLDDSSGKPTIYSSEADATGLQFWPDQQGGITPIANTANLQFVTGSSTTSSSNGPGASATLIEPGWGITKGPSVACGELGGPFGDAFPPAQPLLATCTGLQWPFEVEADGFNTDPQTAGDLTFGTPTGMLYGTSAGARAHQGDDGSTTHAAVNTLRFAPLPGSDASGLPLPPGLLPAPKSDQPNDSALFTIGSMESNTANSWDGPTLVSHAETRLNSLSILGGLVTVDSIVSTAESRFTSGQDPIGGSSTIVQGMRVNGQPVSLGSDGISSGSSNEGDPSALNQALQSLQSHGVTLKLLDATQGVDENGFMAATAPGLALEYDTVLANPAQVPCVNTAVCLGNGSGNYFVIAKLADASAKTLAHDITHGSSSSTSNSSSVAGILPSITPSSGTKPSGFTGKAISAPAPPPPSSLAPPSEASQSQSAGFLGIDPGKIRFLYLAFTLCALGACLGPGLLTPSRLGKG